MERKKSEQQIKRFLKSFFDAEYSTNTLLFDNLKTFLDLIIIILNKIEDTVLTQKRPIDFKKITHSGIIEKLSTIDSFFKQHKIPFDIFEIVNNGSLNIETIDTDYAIENRLTFTGDCISNLIKKETSINVYNTDLITDLFSWIHEITHYRNTTYPISEINHLLEESTAFTYELLMINYLSYNGFSYEAATYQYEYLRNMHAFLYHGYYTIKLYHLYNETGEISLEYYEKIYGYTDDYDKCLEVFREVISQNQRAVFNQLWYTLAAALSTYIYIEYEKDPSYIQTFEQFNESIKTEPLSKCLSIIGITGFNETSINKIESALDDFINEIKDGDDYIITKITEINDYIIQLMKLFIDEKQILFDKIDDALSLVTFLINELEPFFKNRIPYPEVNLLTKASKDEKISIIKDFYKYMHREDTIDNILDHTSITSFNMDEGIDENGDATLLIRASLTGYTTNEGNNKRVDLTETNLLLDSCAWVHEFKHFNNLPDELRSTESYILTEAVSFTEELIYADYLQNIGYYYDGAFIKYETLNNFYVFMQDAYPLDKLISVFVNKGEVSKENYQDLYKDDDDFEDVIDETLTILTDDADDFKNYMRYSIACALSIYMYIMYKHNPSFINKINEFENNINTTPFYDCLQIIGLTGLDDYSLSKVSKALTEYQEELLSYTQNRTLKLYDMKYEKVL